MAKKPEVDIAWREPGPRQADPSPKRVAIWIRVSTEDQARGESPEHHEHRARAYAEIRGWEVVTLYNLAGVSGKAVIAHPEARRMMEDVKAHRITGLIFSKIARLARNTRELLEFAEFFQAQGADLISLGESIDTSTAAGRFFYTMIAGMAAWEREEIASRVAASVPIRAKLGKPLGGAAPFGYRWHEKRLVPDPEEAPTRRLIYELYIEHRRFLTVARILTERGYRTRGGGTFSHTTVERLIRDPTAKGTRRANYTKSLGDGKKWVLKPETEWVETPVEAVVPEEIWTAANALLAERRVKRTPASKRAVQVFGGLVFCHCGAKMYVQVRSPKYVCTKKGCHTKVPQVDLERVFQVELRRFAVSPEAVRASLSEAGEALQAKIELLETLRREDARLAEEAEKVYRLYLAGELTPRGFGSKNTPIEERRVQLEEEIPRLQGEIDFLRIQQLSQEEVVSAAEDLSARWFEIPLEERRAIVQAIVERVTVGRDEIEFSLAYLPSGSPATPSSPSPLRSSQKVHATLGLRASVFVSAYEDGSPEFLQFLRTDPRFYAKTPEELLRRAALIAKTIDGKLPSLVRTPPRTPYTVAPVPDSIAPNYTAGRYVEPQAGSAQPGTYWVNTSLLASRPTYNLVALTLHEAVPGHHLQIALAREITGLPPFRRYLYHWAFCEGWGLYSEWLGLEAGLDTDPYSNFGRLSYEMWRACRLVVDTGIHTRGWSRRQAMDYLAAHTALSLHEVETETDRYTSFPGQALAFKVGQLKIQQLRHQAEQALGPRFDVRDFHDAVLGSGSVPLPVLEQNIARYIATAAASP